MCETEMPGSETPPFENEDNSGNMFQRELSGLMLKKLMGEHALQICYFSETVK